MLPVAGQNVAGNAQGAESTRLCLHQCQRMAQYLHDDLGQKMALLSLGLESLLRQLEQGQEARGMHKALSGMLSTVQEASDCLREVISALRPPKRLPQGLTRAIVNLLTTLSDATGLQISSELRVPEAALERFDEAARLAIFRMIQESLTNILRHANARQVQVNLGLHAGKIEVSVRDDGQGMPTDWQARRHSQRGGLGLAGMQRRADELGGQLQIRPVAPSGTEILFTLAAAA